MLDLDEIEREAADKAHPREYRTILALVSRIRELEAALAHERSMHDVTHAVASSSPRRDFEHVQEQRAAASEARERALEEVSRGLSDLSVTSYEVADYKLRVVELVGALMKGGGR